MRAVAGGVCDLLLRPGRAHSIAIGLTVLGLAGVYLRRLPVRADPWRVVPAKHRQMGGPRLVRLRLTTWSEDSRSTARIDGHGGIRLGWG